MPQTLKGLQNVCFSCRSKLQANATTVHLLHRRRIRTIVGHDDGAAVSEDDFMRQFHEGNDVHVQKEPKGTAARIPRETRNPRHTGHDRRDPKSVSTSSTRPDSMSYKRKSRHGNAKGGESGALAMFKSVVQGQEEKPGSSVAPSSPSSGTLALLRDLSELEFMMSNGSTTAECFKFFDSKISPQVAELREEVPKIVKEHTRLLLQKIAREKGEDCFAANLPTVSRISQLMMRFSSLEPEPWASLTLRLISHICRISISSKDYPLVEDYENAMARRDTLLRDLWESWKVFNLNKFTALRLGGVEEALKHSKFRSFTADEWRPSHPLDETNGGQHWLPFQKRRLSYAFTNLFPQYDPKSLVAVSHAAILTLLLFTDSFSLRGEARRETFEFVNSVQRISQMVPPTYEDLINTFSQYDGVSEYFDSRWPAFRETLYQKNKGTSKLRISDLADRLRWKDSSDLLHRQLGQSLKSRNLGLAKDTWALFWGDAETPTEERKIWLQQHADLFDYFILVYMAHRQPSLAVAVWNSMEKAGIRPSLMSWTSMMEGCRRSRNLDGLKAVWNKLIATGTPLDVPIWTARITALLDLGDVDAGLQALNEMGRKWKESNRPGNAIKAVAPTIEPVNAALAGLLRLDKMPAAKGVLEWAGNHGIQPDIFTFNTLLRPMVRQGQDKEVQHVFETMKQMNVEADVATYTILLDGALTELGDKAPEDQIAVVERILNEMAAAGLQANMLTFGKMIYLLLQEGDETSASVNAVLGHVWSKGLELSSHIYTMLAEHYFSRDPPKPERVTALIENRRLRENRNIDRVFWDRVIKGYCQVGDTKTAWELYKDIDSSGALIIYSTLYELLVAFIRNDNREAAMQLMDRVLRKRESLDEMCIDENVRKWRHRFWHLADRYKILPEELQKWFRAAMASRML